jgi:translation initiation factor IF-1
VLPNGHYKVVIPGTDFEIEAYKWGKMKKFSIKLLPGDWVKVEVNEYDITKWRIVYRYKGKPTTDSSQGQSQATEHSNK